MKFAYYPGCSAKSTCPELDISTKAVAEKLDIDLVELDVAACSGAREIRGSNREFFLALNARTLALAEAIGRDVMTICATCLLNLTEVNALLKRDGALRKRINADLARIDLEYHGGVEVTHLLWVLLRDLGADELGRRIVRPLAGLRVAPFYGCHILRPKETLGFDDPDAPLSLDELIRVLGAEPVEYDGKNRCCGFHVLMAREDMALALSGKRLAEARDGEADCLVTTCPLCHTALDPYQGAIERRLDRKLNLPILHLPQLVGLGLGLDPSALKLSDHVVSTAPVLAKVSALPR